jgi:hypothetical protein
MSKEKMIPFKFAIPFKFDKYYNQAITELLLYEFYINERDFENAWREGAD